MLVLNCNLVEDVLMVIVKVVGLAFMKKNSKQSRLVD